MNNLAFLASLLMKFSILGSLLISSCNSSPIARITGITMHPTENNKLTLTVEIPPALVNYNKGLDVKDGGSFSLSTPMENYFYVSQGSVNLRCVRMEYYMQSHYSPNLMCFYLRFLSMKGDYYSQQS